MEVQGGYELERFNSPVPHGLRCNICKEVLREPKLCKNGGHPFCHHCIQQNLVQTKKCPVCRKHLTPETLVHPQECFLRILKDLEIKCDYHERGCYRPVLLGNLQDHVTQCGFAPVTCEKCGMQINKKDKDNHEKSFCPLKAITECKDCGNIKNTQNKMKTTQDEMKASITKQGKFVSEQFAQIIKEQERDIQIGTSIIANQEDLKRKHDQMEECHAEIKEKMEQMEKTQNEQTECQAEMKQIMERMEKNQNEQKNDVKDIKEQFKQFIEKLNPVEDEPSNKPGMT